MDKNTVAGGGGGDGGSSSRNIIPTLPRDARGSLEVFNPSSVDSCSSVPPSRPENPLFGSWNYSWSSNHSSQEKKNDLTSNSWMAIVREEDEHVHDTSVISRADVEITKDNGEEVEKVIKTGGGGGGGEVGAAAKRAAEWGLVLKTDEETGKPQGVQVRNSNDNNDPTKSSRRNSGNSVRSSGEFSDDGTFYFLL